jgi:hypothetical protein
MRDLKKRIVAAILAMALTVTAVACDYDDDPPGTTVLGYFDTEPAGS